VRRFCDSCDDFRKLIPLVILADHTKKTLSGFEVLLKKAGARDQAVAGAVPGTPKGFSLRCPEEFVATIQSDPPTVAVLQYCPFSWGVPG
jgi:hypothetical protein